jgi:hypothetical protein
MHLKSLFQGKFIKILDLTACGEVDLDAWQVL